MGMLDDMGKNADKEIIKMKAKTDQKIKDNKEMSKKKSM